MQDAKRPSRDFCETDRILKKDTGTPPLVLKVAFSFTTPCAERMAFILIPTDQLGPVMLVVNRK